ncbi:MAG: nuclear transport factor 2 family protein [Gemmatimonadaceae bacterium]|jgi:ketosteroid isomerase-like protein|nr:nuclear transport factor 2 family protein [Gemmatimonadaceae bacterium]
MTTRSRLFVASALLGLSAPLQAQSARSADVRAAEAAVRAVFAAGERGDLAALDTLYAGDSLTIVEGAGINRGWSDYRDHHLGPELKEMKNFRYRPFEIEPRVHGDMAWVTFRYALQADMNGRAVDALGRGTMILERRGRGSAARWVVRHSQTASRARRAGDPPMPAGA